MWMIFVGIFASDSDGNCCVLKIFGNFQLFQQPHTSHQHQMIKITNRKSIENHLFSKITIRLFIISGCGGCGTQSNITHFV